MVTQPLSWNDLVCLRGREHAATPARVQRTSEYYRSDQDDCSIEGVNRGLRGGRQAEHCRPPRVPTTMLRIRVKAAQLAATLRGSKAWSPLQRAYANCARLVDRARQDHECDKCGGTGIPGGLKAEHCRRPRVLRKAYESGGGRRELGYSWKETGRTLPPSKGANKEGDRQNIAAFQGCQ